MLFIVFFFFNDTATTEIYTLSLHDALPISRSSPGEEARPAQAGDPAAAGGAPPGAALVLPGAPLVPGAARKGLLHLQPPVRDRKSTRLNSSHANLSYAVFCLKKKNNKDKNHTKCHRPAVPAPAGTSNLQSPTRHRRQ